jgi:hypothetical protein
MVPSSGGVEILTEGKGIQPDQDGDPGQP